MSYSNKSFNAYLLLLLILLIANVFPAPANGQSTKMQLSSNKLDFGKIATVSYIPKTIEFTNKSAERLAILIIEKSPNVKVQFERRFFNPGERGIIALSYAPRTTGSFEETVFIYTNLDDDPYALQLTGNVVSILECFPDPKNMLKRSIEAIDKDSKAPVPNTEVNLVHNHKFNNPVKVKLDKEGKAVEEMPIGMYHITATADKYEQLKTEVYVPKSQPYVILELTPRKKAPLPPPPPPQIIEPIAEVKPVETTVEPETLVTSTDLPEDKYAANNLIFLLDISTSMKSGKKFILLQQSVNNLAMILRPIDNVSIITYSNEANIVLTGANGADKEKILTTIQDIQPYGITRGVKGLSTAYNLATESYIKGGNNQIILMTDGEFSEKGLSDSYYEDLLSGHAAQGISLSILGFGVNREAIDRMKQMCKAGQGSFILVKSDEFIKEVLINEVKQNSFMGD